ncbi:MAG TPA: hypothetical protein PKZ84_20370 [Anaerolineae bacterium]|nr:hypothetical protein [Anaerolineae bacterium]HQI86936.1 hypothetical protein [Anaerolineae bacterium]
MIWRRCALLLGMACILLGCNLFASPAPATIPERAVTRAPEIPPATVTARPPTTSSADPCPARRDIAFPSRPAAFADYAETVRAYLAAGGDPRRIPALLSEWQARTATGETLARADLNGDGVTDSVVAFINPATESYPPAGMLAIYTCREGTVRFLYTYKPGAWFGLNLIGATDVTQDGLADLVFAEVSCSANTCWHTLRVWSWVGKDFQERMGSKFSFPYADFALADGRILAGSHGDSSVEAGPQRPVTTTLAWDGSAVTVTATVAGPAIYRYHVLCDGDEALFAGKYAHALDAYLQARNNKTLKAWAVAVSRDEEEHWFRALADWRLLLVELRLQNMPNAQAYYNELVDEFLPATAGHAVAALAQRFWESYTVHGDMALACVEAIRAPEALEVLDFLNSFGYANPTYTWDDLCPFLSTD